MKYNIKIEIREDKFPYNGISTNVEVSSDYNKEVIGKKILEKIKEIQD